MCFFFNDTATTEIYTYLHTLSLHDSLPISAHGILALQQLDGLLVEPVGLAFGIAIEEVVLERACLAAVRVDMRPCRIDRKSTRLNPVTNAHLVCRLLLEKKKHIKNKQNDHRRNETQYTK